MPLSSYLKTSPALAEHVYLHPSAQVIGEVKIGADASIWCNAVLRGDVNRIEIGRGTNVQDLTIGHVSHKTAEKPEGSPLIVGDYVTIGHSVILHGCRIGNECLIGMGSIIMDDVVIPDRVMVGAGSMVTPGKVLESGMLYMGRPAKAVRALTEEELAYLRYSAEHYIRLKDDYLRMDEQAAARGKVFPDHVVF
ncbi:gamma carbonic anhydrase family protein [Ferriphaselus sp. R-1]|uniref:gamma carbonic anhydrase family protein n=1 Tax=Ferriphaselus sp. R-1 TaxID=1485544 RepID=UPI00068BFECF|nr:gamma carbonic anhydrase family protein [Ferriphaselus sp. R-1]